MLVGGEPRGRSATTPTRSATVPDAKVVARGRPGGAGRRAGRGARDGCRGTRGDVVRRRPARALAAGARHGSTTSPTEVIATPRRSSRSSTPTRPTAPSRFDQLAAPAAGERVAALALHGRLSRAAPKMIRFDMGTSCGAGNVDIQVIRLPRSRRRVRGPGLRPSSPTDVRAVVGGSQAGPRDWIVYADADAPWARSPARASSTTAPSAEAPGATSHDGGRARRPWSGARRRCPPRRTPTRRRCCTRWGTTSAPSRAARRTRPATVGRDRRPGTARTSGTSCATPTAARENALTYPVRRCGPATVTGDVRLRRRRLLQPGPRRAARGSRRTGTCYASAMLGGCAGAALRSACDVETRRRR